ncbi:hypothetical protein ACFQHV_02500 [Promicromonospora thailandica]|uniref:hypothetical protein n=1 Tax=Promicromonospora thailandica TaxID=765201 RepID=UPI0036100718
MREAAGPDQPAVPRRAPGDGRQLQAELDAAAEAVAEHRALAERFGVLRSALDGSRTELTDAAAALDRATAGIRRLGRPVPSTILAVVRGRRAALLADRRTEQATAEARAAAARTAIADREREIAAVRATLRGLGDVDAWYAGALAAAEAWSIQTASPAVPELRRLADASQVLRRELAELDELSATADRARTALVGALGHLDDAWGRAQAERRARTRRFRRSPILLTDGRKADQMDQAAGLMRKAGESLRELARKIDGVGHDRADRLAAVQFLGPFDFLFDTAVLHRFFVDGAYDAGDRVHDALDAVDRAQAAVTVRSVEVAGRLADLDQRRERLLTGP